MTDGFQVTGGLTVETVTTLFGNPPEFAGSRTSVSLAQVTELDSAGLALLVYWQQCATRAGGSMRYTDVPSQAASMMQVSGLKHALIGDS